MANKYSFQYELVQYKWPRWLHQQTEKQRIIWGYKILFLDVLFPLVVDKFLFVDADQVSSGRLGFSSSYERHWASFPFLNDFIFPIMEKYMLSLHYLEYMEMYQPDVITFRICIRHISFSSFFLLPLLHSCDCIVYAVLYLKFSSFNIQTDSWKIHQFNTVLAVIANYLPQS